MRTNDLWTSLLALSLTLGLTAACGGGGDDGGNGKNGGNGDNGGATDTGSTTPDTGTEGDTTMQGDGGGSADDAEGGGTEDAGETEDTGPDGTFVNFSGMARLHPVSSSNSNLDFADTRVDIWASNKVLFGSDPSPVETRDGSPARSSIDGSGSTEVQWSVENVDKDAFALAAVGVIDDSDGASNDRYIRTATGLAVAEDIEENNSGGNLFAIGTKAEESLSARVGDELDSYDGNPGELIQKGFIIVQIVNSSGDPVEGAKLRKMEQGSPAPVSKVVYPSKDLQSATSGGDASTSASGIAIIPSVDSAPQYTAVKNNMSFGTAQAGGPDGFAFVATISAN